LAVRVVPVDQGVPVAQAVAAVLEVCSKQVRRRRL